VQRRLGAAAAGFSGRIRRNNVVDRDDTTVAEGRHLGRLTRSRRQCISPVDRPGPQQVEVDPRCPEAKHRGRDPVTRGIGILLDKPYSQQRLQEAVRGSLGQADSIGDSRQRNGLRFGGQQTQDRSRPLHRLHRHRHQFSVHGRRLPRSASPNTAAFGDAERGRLADVTVVVTVPL
jgi:hypothetical protein